MNHFIVDGKYKDILEHHGIDVGEVLRKAKLPGDILNHKTIKMKEEQYYHFLDAIEIVGNVPGIAVALSTSDNIEQFSPPIFASFCSKNAKMSIERLARYKKLIGPMNFEISFIVNIIRRATKEDIKPVRITTTMELRDSSLEDFIGVKPVRGDKNLVVFELSDMEIPFISFDEGMWDYFEPELNRRLADLDVDDSVSARVRAALIELLPTGLCGVDEVAAELGLSKRTLQRKLSIEHTTFQKQLNNTRELLALHYIQNTDMSTNDIAFLLGYAELNSFLRAFAVWTGKNISAYRKE